MRKILMIAIMALFLFSCFDSDIPDDNTSFFSILIKARIGSFSDQIPRTKVEISYGIDKNGLITWVDTIKTDDNGYAKIDSAIKEDIYYLTLVDHNDYGENDLYQVFWYEGISDPDTVRVGVHYYWNFNQYVITIKEDTTTLFAGITSYIFNNGIRDTLICTFNTSYLPSWFTFSVRNDTFPPMNRSDNINSLWADYNDNSLPIDSLPYTIRIPVSHQYGQTELKYLIDL